ncbi:MAG: hypothetical protein OXB84_06670, partial [Halobacteriovoraceae bacterium]|nr:hypothetical protein [Halobacteriovoraceae bacterium]
MEESGKLEELKKHSKNVQEFMDKQGITETLESGTSKVKEVSNIAEKHLDQLSGKKIMETVEKRLQLQTEYNDLLASKLDEALEKIKKL